jgi:EF-hand domain pair
VKDAAPLRQPHLRGMQRPLRSGAPAATARHQHGKHRVRKALLSALLPPGKLRARARHAPVRDRTTLDNVKPGAQEHGRLREDFDLNDLNHDGRLTLGEFIRFMRSVDGDMTAEQCEIGFDEIDTNRDGAIEFEEFVAWSTQRRKASGARRHTHGG